jgi:hypothetical protein
LVFATTLNSCKKSSSSNDQITYEVIITNACPNSVCTVSYNGPTGVPITLSNQKSGWKVTFENTLPKPVLLDLRGAFYYDPAVCTKFGNVTLNIYVNGTLVQTGNTVIQYSLR